MICFACDSGTGRVRYWHEADEPGAGEAGVAEMPQRPGAETGKAPILYWDGSSLEWRQEEIPPEPEPDEGPTREDVREARAAAYRERVDPLTAEIARLRDMAPSDPRIAEAEAERERAVAEIVAAHPYPDESV